MLVYQPFGRNSDSLISQFEKVAKKDFHVKWKFWKFLTWNIFWAGNFFAFIIDFLSWSVILIFTLGPVTFQASNESLDTHSGHISSVFSVYSSFWIPIEIIIIQIFESFSILVIFQVVFLKTQWARIQNKCRKYAELVENLQSRSPYTHQQFPMIDNLSPTDIPCVPIPVFWYWEGHHSPCRSLLFRSQFLF